MMYRHETIISFSDYGKRHDHGRVLGVVRYIFFQLRVIVSDTISVSPFRNGLRRKGRKVAFYKDSPDSRLLSHDSDSSQSLRIQELARLMAANY